MVCESDAVHVEDFAFGPFRAGPEVADRVDDECGIVLDAVGWDGGVEVNLDEEAICS